MFYHYDSLNRLIGLEAQGNRTTFVYDAFGRCLQIKDPTKTRHLLYQKEREIGSTIHGKLDEFRLCRPTSSSRCFLRSPPTHNRLLPVRDYSVPPFQSRRFSPADSVPDKSVPAVSVLAVSVLIFDKTCLMKT
ncbi:MAG: hypothetical protein ACHQ1D_11305 [Nitrososphaerales archaeon]